MTDYGFARKLVAEAIGTAFLLATVVGSGIMAEMLAGGNVAIALLGNTVATGCILMVLILIFGPVSGAHFNPAVTLSFWLQKQISGRDAIVYVLVQTVAAIGGAALAHLMFDSPDLLMASSKARTGLGQWTGEFIATFGLLATILGCVRLRPDAVPYAVGLFISAGYWFTSSTSFANPAVTIARSMTDSFSGILPDHAPAFIVAQIIGAVAATYLFKWLYGELKAG
ncbi:MAG TPA: aquaporin family protein [Rhodospirillaceae bacterium]|nr:aquaporin family protein [Rhodospirillaceae bacterium]HAA93990.1 aquaporin family protein [Rhodospirillaceae bacterium]HAT34591.1 aquaporin family protein [Rhodospirillaceae bacterium]|tara:strand:+ start:97 stop:774 length:678 start_codon:yes stop_codon:yes gene_type:complete